MSLLKKYFLSNYKKNLNGHLKLMKIINFKMRFYIIFLFLHINMIDYYLVQTYENHAWGEKYSTLCIKSNGDVYKSDNKVEIFENLMNFPPICRIKLDKMKNIEKHVIYLLGKKDYEFTNFASGCDAGTIKNYLCIRNKYIFLGESGDKSIRSKYTNFIVNEIKNIDNAVVNYMNKKN